MSGSRPTVGIRITAEGADRARQEVVGFTQAGEAAMARLRTATAAAAPEMQRLAQASDVAQRAFAGMGGSLGRIGSTFTGVSGVASGLAAGFLALGAAATLGATQIAKAGDEASASLAKLASASGGLAQAQQVYERLFALSQQTGVAVSESAGAFTRFAVAAKEIGGTNDQVVRLVAGIQKAGIVAGTSTEETKAAVQQLGQALASGKLQGDELRSLLENMPQLAQALARELGTNIGQLRKMGEEGKLTADVVFPALLRASEKIGDEFAKMPVTMSRAKDILIAATQDFGARLDRITGLSQTFARFMQQGASALNAAGRAIAPSEREAADQAVEAAQARLSALRARVSPEPEQRLSAAERRALNPIPRDPFDTTRSRLTGQPVERPAGADTAAEMAEAENALREALVRQQEIRRADRELQRAEAEDAAHQRAESLRTRLGTEVRDVAEFADKRLKIARETAEKLKKIEEAEAAGVTTMPGGARFDAATARAGVLREQAEALKKVAEEEAKGGEEARKAAEKRQGVIDKMDAEVKAAQGVLASTVAGTAASHEMSIALEIETKLREAGIPALEKRTEAEKKAAEAIGASVRKLDQLKSANKEAEEAAKKAKDWHDRSWNEVAAIGERAFDRLGDAIVNAFTSGQGAAVNFGNVAKAILSSVVSDIAKLGIVNPILNSLFVGSSGLRPTLAGALDGGGGLGGIPGLGSLFGGSGSLSEYLFGGVAAGPVMPGMAARTTSGLLGSGGNLFGIPGLSSLLGSAGIGAGIGGFTASLLGGNSTYGSIGGGLGALAGQILIPIPGVGAILGGLLGGAGGGLIGPHESVRGYGFRLQSQGWGPDAAPTNAMASSLLPIDRTYYNEEGAQAFAAADQLVAQTNAYLSARGLTVGGASIIGGNRNGADYSWADAGTLGEGFSRLRFGATDNAQLNTALGAKTFTDITGLQAFVEGFTQVQATIKGLTDEAVPAFTASLNAINKSFDDAHTAAVQYGVSEDGLTEARQRGIAALEAQRAETLRQSGVALSIRSLAATGATQEAELARQAEAARQEVDSFSRSLDALAISAEDKAARLVRLEEVQAQERAAIITRYAEQAAAALNQYGGGIRAFLDSLLTGTAAGASPTDRLAAAQTAFERDRTLAMGGDRDALGRITQTAGTLLTAGRDVYASGAGYQSILSGVQSGLGNLPVVQGYDAQQAASLAAIQQALTAGTISTTTLILPGGNTVQLAAGLNFAPVLEGLDVVARNVATLSAATVAGLDGVARGIAVSNTGLSAVNDNILATGRALSAGQVAANDIAAGVGTALGTSLAAINGSSTAIGNATNTSLASINTNFTSALNATNTSLASINTNFTSALNAGNTIEAEGVRLAFDQRTTMIARLDAALARLETLIAAVQTGATLTASEARAGAVMITDEVRRLRGTVRDAA